MPPRRLPASLARAFIALAVTAGAFAFPAAPVMAWGNGGGDGYGTHDWIIDQALKVLDGRVDGWIDAQTARLSSDDPDTVERPIADHNDHIYHDRGRRGGAIDRIASEFDFAQASYARGDYEDASYHIGLLAHFYGDILQPYHTAYAAIPLIKQHLQYETLVGALTRHPNDMPSWSSTRRTVSTFTNIRTKAVASAAYSRALFPALRREFAPDQSHLNASVRAITAKVMKRAANDLADVIWSISQGVGAQPQVGSLKVSVKWVGVKSGFAKQAVFVTARDVAGKPIEGISVDVAWPTTTGVRHELLRTDGKGFQQTVRTRRDEPEAAAARRGRDHDRPRPGRPRPTPGGRSRRRSARAAGDSGRPSATRRSCRARWFRSPPSRTTRRAAPSRTCS